MIFKVLVTRAAQKDLSKVPPHIRDKFEVWMLSVTKAGLERTRLIPGFHDEPLKGERAGERSIRLSKSYRAIYRIVEDGCYECVSVEEVNKHDY